MPHARSDQSMVYDLKHDKIVMFGGFYFGDPSERLNDLWDFGRWFGEKPVHILKVPFIEAEPLPGTEYSEIKATFYSAAEGYDETLSKNGAGLSAWMAGSWKDTQSRSSGNPMSYVESEWKLEYGFSDTEYGQNKLMQLIHGNDMNLYFKVEPLFSAEDYSSAKIVTDYAEVKVSYRLPENRVGAHSVTVGALPLNSAEILLDPEPNAPGGKYHTGTKIRIVVTPEPGYIFSGNWSGDDAAKVVFENGNYYITVTEEIEVSAEIEVQP